MGRNYFTGVEGRLNYSTVENMFVYLRNFMETIFQLNRHLDKLDSLVEVQQIDVAKLLELQNICIEARDAIDVNGPQMLNAIRGKIMDGATSSKSDKERQKFFNSFLNRYNLLLSDFKQLFHNKLLNKKTLHYSYVGPNGDRHTKTTSIHDMVTDLENYLEALKFTIKSECSAQEPTAKSKELLSLKSIFGNDAKGRETVKKAIVDLKILKTSSDRTITGFIDGSRVAGVLPDLPATKLMQAIFFELGKPHNTNTKPRYDKEPYSKSLKATKEYFGVK
jgi:hypothetical protein